MVAAQQEQIKIAEDEIKHVPLTSIYYDADWNARSSANVQAEGDVVTKDSEGNDIVSAGLAGFAEGIATDGQNTPVELREIPKEMAKKAGNAKYHLVAGARRFFAIVRLNADADRVKKCVAEGRSVVPNTGNGTIRAVIRPMNESDAIARNIAENSDRLQLDTPDLAVGVHRLDQLKMPQAVIATRLGISQSYVSTLARITKDLQPVIFAHWRNGGEFQGQNIGSNRVRFDGINEISRLEKDRQIDAYLYELGVKRDEAATKKPVLAAKKQAARIGKMLAILQKEGALEITEKPWVECIEHVIKLNKSTKKARVKQQIADALDKAFAEELAKDDTKKGEEDDGGDDEE